MKVVSFKAGDLASLLEGNVEHLPLDSVDWATWKNLPATKMFVEVLSRERIKTMQSLVEDPPEENMMNELWFSRGVNETYRCMMENIRDGFGTDDELKGQTVEYDSYEEKTDE